MSILLRVEMIVVAILFLLFVVRSINKNHFLLKNAFGWLLLALGLVIIAIFPQLLINLANAFDFQEASNFLYLVAVMLLLVNAITNSVLFSKQQTQITNLIQEISILKSLIKENKK